MIRKRFVLMICVLLTAAFFLTVAAFGQNGEKDADRNVQIPGQPEKVPETWQGVVYTAIIVFALNVPGWIRELKKGRDFKRKEDGIGVIKGSVLELQKEAGAQTNAIDAIQRQQASHGSELAKISTGIANMEGRCSATTAAFATRLGEINKKTEINAQSILEIARNGKSSRKIGGGAGD